MSQPLKRAGFQQGIYEESSTAKEMVGCIRFTRDGRAYTYSKNGAVALSPGKTTSAAAISANVTNLAATNAAAIDAKVITQTVATDTYAADYFRGGMLQVNDGTGKGYQYLILSSSAITAGGSLTVEIEEGIKVALVATTSEISFVKNPWMATVVSATEETFPTGVPPIDVTIAYYYWSQTGGLNSAFSKGTAAVATMLAMADTDGAVDAINTTLDIDQPIIGIQVGTGVADEYKPIWLTIR